MAALPVSVAVLAMVDPAERIAPHRLPSSPYLDTEASTNIALAVRDASHMFSVTLSFEAAASDGVEVATGRDAALADGRLSPAETSLQFGWDGGHWFLSATDTTNRVEMPPAGDGTRKTLRLSIGVHDGVELYGVSPSAAMNDAALSLQTVGGMMLCTTNLTVLWVEISMRCGQDEPFSEDNDFIAPIGTNMLGRQSYEDIVYVQNGVTNVIIGGFVNVIEFKGTVHPSDFPFEVSFTRDCIDSLMGYRFPSATSDIVSGEIMTRGQEPNGNDPIQPEFHDPAPLPNGYIYDVDTPGIMLRGGALNPAGTIIWVKQNFVQYSIYGNKRCSDDFPWFNRITARKVTPEGSLWYEFFFSDEFAGGNSCGEGRCNVTH